MDSDAEGLFLTDKSIKFLKTAKKWAMFLAVVGFIMVAFLIVMGLFFALFFDMGAVAQNYPASAVSAFSSVFYFILAAIYFIPVWFLYKFSKRMDEAISQNDVDVMTKSFRHLKNSFVSFGILTILAIIFYAIIFVVSLILAAGMTGGMMA